MGAERVCQTHRLEMRDWGRAVALILPSGHHQDWLYRWMAKKPDAGWDKLVEDFVTAFQQQTSMDILETESLWESLQQGTQTVDAYYAKFVELFVLHSTICLSESLSRRRMLATVAAANCCLRWGGID